MSLSYNVKEKIFPPTDPDPHIFNEIIIWLVMMCTFVQGLFSRGFTAGHLYQDQLQNEHISTKNITILSSNPFEALW